MKTDARRLPPSTQETIRRKAVDAVEGGMTQTKAAQLFGVARKTIWMWLKAYRAGGADALKARKRGPKGEQATLKGWQAAAICSLIRIGIPNNSSCLLFCGRRMRCDN